MFQRLEEIRDDFYAYIEARIELFKADIQTNVENAIVQVAYLFIIVLVALLAMVFSLVLLAVFLNQLFDSQYIGFIIVLGLLMVLLTVIISQKQNILRLIKRFFSKRF